MQINREVLREVEAALEWAKGRQDDARIRMALNAPEDPHVEALCNRYGYGAVIDAAARLWARRDNSGAFFVGGCLGDTSAALALASLRAAMGPQDVQGLTDAEMREQGRRCGCKGTDEYCPCQNVPFRSTLDARKAMEQDDAD